MNFEDSLSWASGQDAADAGDLFEFLLGVGDVQFTRSAGELDRHRFDAAQTGGEIFDGVGGVEKAALRCSF